MGRGGGSERFRGAQGARPSPSGLGFGAQKRGGSSCVCVPSAPRWVWGTQGCGEGVRASLTEPPPTAIGGALRQHPAGPHPDQGQLRGAGGHRRHQGHLPQVPQQVRGARGSPQPLTCCSQRGDNQRASGLCQEPVVWRGWGPDKRGQEVNSPKGLAQAVSQSVFCLAYVPVLCLGFISGYKSDGARSAWLGFCKKFILESGVFHISPHLPSHYPNGLSWHR